MRPLLVVVLLVSLTGCVSRGPATPAAPPATTTTTEAEPTNPVADSETVRSGMVDVRTWLTGCAPTAGEPGCDWATAESVISPVLAEIDNAVELSPHPQAYVTVRLANASAAVDDALFELALNIGDWNTLVRAWDELEAAVAS